ncbi:hypothetical protein [Larkinella harenae]
MESNKLNPRQVKRQNRCTRWLLTIALLAGLFAFLGTDFVGQERIQQRPKTELAVTAGQPISPPPSAKDQTISERFFAAFSPIKAIALRFYNLQLRSRIRVYCSRQFIFVRARTFMQFKGIPARADDPFGFFFRR